MKPAEDYILEEMEQELIEIRNLCIVATVVLICVGAFAWVVL